MAGSYPDAPSRRIAYDADGSVFVVRTSQDSGATFGPQAAVSGADTVELNDEDNVAISLSGSAVTRRWWTWLFPELREFDGFFGRASAVNFIGAIETSDDTTNGVDGTWTSETADYADPDVDVFANYRSPTAFARSNVRGLRVFVGTSASGAQPRAFHVYGDLTPGQTPDRLLFIDEATGLEFTLPQDWGDVPRGGSADKQLRFYNNSASLTATTIQYTVEDLYRGSAAWYTSTLPAGAVFQGTNQIASLAPDTTTGIVTLRRIVPGSGDNLGLHAARLYLNVASWA